MNTANLITPPSVSPTVDADNPWPGLLSFTEADSKFFRGRDSEIDVLQRLVARERLTVLFGLSGLGKSSLLLAGLFPVLRRQGAFPVYLRLGFQDGADPLRVQTLTEIAREAGRRGGEAPPSEPKWKLWEYFHQRDADFWDEHNRLLMPVLVFDQFEEIFTIGKRNGRQAGATEAFLDELTDLVEGRPPLSLQAMLETTPKVAGQYSFARHHYKVILSLREDFLPELEGLKARMPSLALNRYRIQRMNGEAAFQVVAQAPHLIDAKVAEEVVRFVAAARDASTDISGLEIEPALLSIVCRELNMRRKTGERITSDLLEGTREEIISGFYERSVADLDPKVRVFIEEQLLTTTGYRDSVAEEKALHAGITLEALERLLQRRLLRREERVGVARLELTHDLLTSVVTASRDKRRREEAETHERRARLEAEEHARQVHKKLLRSRIVAAVLAFLTLLAMLGAGWALYMRKQAFAAKTSAQYAETRANEAEGHATEALKEVRRRLELQLASSDPTQVSLALEQLISVHQREPHEVLALIPDERFSSYPFFLTLVTTLDDEGHDATTGGWARQSRRALGQRMSAARKIAPPPAESVDDGLNKRVLMKAVRFRMGSQDGRGCQACSDEMPAHWVQLRTFYVQQHIVTNREYARFNPKYRSRHPSEPAVNVNWYDALMYAVWIGGDLPTEAQWELAARGTDGRKYSWGNDEPQMSEDPLGRIAHPNRPSAAGIWDLSGSVWQWCRDVYGPYPASEQKDPTGPKEGFVRVLRGGSSYDRAEFMRAAYRYNYHPAVSSGNAGFRVVWATTDVGG
jgi:formylglycine-generating enzyme required for sulfatase activity